MSRQKFIARRPGLGLVVIALCFAAGCKVYDAKLMQFSAVDASDAGADGSPETAATARTGPPESPQVRDAEPPDIDAGTKGSDAGANKPTSNMLDAAPSGAADPQKDAAPSKPAMQEPTPCGEGQCWWSSPAAGSCASAGKPLTNQRPDANSNMAGDTGELYFGWTHVRLGESAADGKVSDTAWQSFGLDLDGRCTNAATCPSMVDVQACKPASAQIPFDGALCRDNRFGHLESVLAAVPEIGGRLGLSEAAMNCNLWRGSYNVVLKLSGYNGASDDSDVRVDLYMSTGLEHLPPWDCADDTVEASYPLWQVSAPWQIDLAELNGAPVAKPGSLPASKLADAHAYVRGGYLVAQLPSDALLRFASNSTTQRGVALQLQESQWLGKLQRAQDGTWHIEDGLVAGRMRANDVLQSFRRLGLCGGSGTDGFYRVVSDALHDDADLLASGQVDPAMPCDAISFGFAFSASQLTPGSAVAAPNLVECCASGVELLDCDPKCGDGRLNGDERCDTAITGRNNGACPRGCTAIDACTPQVISGSDCYAHCVPAPISAVGPKDGCCPKGANGSQDADCPSVCGNGVVEPNETCDPSASCGKCSSDDACAVAKPSGAAESCDFRCELVSIQDCKNDDGCCPSTCNSTNDSDCSPSCGNKLLEAHETCEAGTDQPCPDSCDDGDPCSKDSQTGNAQSCNVVCSHTPITTAANGDGCCPSSANANSDDDCKAVCGNGTQESGEACDDGNDKAGDGCSDCKVDSAEQRCFANTPKIGDDECMMCSCQKCTDALSKCYGAANADEANACAALVDCAHSHGCSSTGCYCGNVNSVLCLLGQANGACRGQVETASKSKSPGDVFSRNNNTDYAVGRANAVTQCIQNNCASACSQ